MKQHFKSLIVLLFSFLFLPLTILAFDIPQNNTYCITPGLKSPREANTITFLGDSYVDKAYLGVYQMASILGLDYNSLLDQLIITRAMGYSSCDATGDCQFLEYLNYKYSENQPGYPFEKMVCAGAYAAGVSTKYNCSSLLSDYDLKWLGMSYHDFIPDVVENKNLSNPNNLKFAFSLDGDGYENAINLLNDIPSLKSKSKIIPYKCVSDNYTCSIESSSVNLLSDNNFYIKLSSNGQQSNLLETVRIYFEFDFPFVATNAEIYTYDGIHLQSLIHFIGIKETNRKRTFYKDIIVQITQSETPKKCEIKNNKFYKDGVEKEFSSFISDKVCCDSTTEEKLNGNEENIKLYKKVCLGEEEIPKKCEVKIVNNKKFFYYAGITDADVKNNPTTQDLYQNLCIAKDTVYIETECGAKAKLGKEEVVINNGINVNLLTCKNESYIDYTHSYIWQLPMSKVLERVEKAESGAENLEGIWNNSGLNNYMDKSYMTNNINGKDGQNLTGISTGNNYCMLFTSENNDIYFPGTAIATSGRFFVFNELNSEECINSITPSANCFRQPYIDGKINLVMHTNYDKWSIDYNSAIEKEKETYNKWQKEQTLNNEQIYKVAKANREMLEKYKIECEAHNNLANYWNYNLKPDLKFNYAQKVYGGKENSEVIPTTIDMVISNESVKYWPNVSTDVSCKEINHSDGRNVSYNIKYGNVNEIKTFTSIENYSTECIQKIYYRPKQITYSIIPSGQYILNEASYQSNPISMLHNGIEIGYVYNVKLTTYEGNYTTSFIVDNLGHQSLNGKSSVQLSVDKYKQDYGITEFSSKCVYCNQEGEFKRVCQACDEPELTPSYIYRTISLNNINPNSRENSNWSDVKGIQAKERIESLSGDNVVAMTNNNAKYNLLANGNIYDDKTREYLEYEITLTSKDMQIIRKNTNKTNYVYGDLTICGSTGKITEKDTDVSYCYICNEDGKECESAFVDAFSNNSTTTNTRKYKWKYFINGKWEFGNWKDIVKNYSKLDGFEDGRYPDPINQEAFIKYYKNWP